MPLIAASFDEWWSRISALAGPLSGILGGMPDEARTALRGRLEEAALPYRTDGRRAALPRRVAAGNRQARRMRRTGLAGQPSGSECSASQAFATRFWARVSHDSATRSASSWRSSFASAGIRIRIAG